MITFEKGPWLAPTINAGLALVEPNKKNTGIDFALGYGTGSCQLPRGSITVFLVTLLLHSVTISVYKANWKVYQGVVCPALNMAPLG